LLRRRAARAALLAALGAAALVLAGRALAVFVDARANRVSGPRSAPAPARDADYADLHGDLLLWDRDPLARHGRGHMDLPRLLEGGVALQVFSVPTHAPRGINISRNEYSALDLVTALTIAQGRPPRTWFDHEARALDRAARLAEAAARSDGRLVLARDKETLVAALRGRRPGRGPVAAVLALEGGLALRRGPAAVRALHGAGYRMMSLSHFTDTPLGGSAHGAEKGGLTDAGRAVLGEMARLGIILDLAHASPALFDEALREWKGPVVVSHAGVKATCDSPRNLSDAQLKALAARGGLIGVGLWPSATCGADLASAARAIAHAVKVAGPKAVALGTDFDGAVSAPIDAAGLPRLAEELARAGLSKGDADCVMGGNARRYLSEALPARQ
jgi:microsomal dipeptidase-like Zn-dependent dipeptidase